MDKLAKLRTILLLMSSEEQRLVLQFAKSLAKEPAMDWGKVQLRLEGLAEVDLRSLIHMALNSIPTEAERGSLIQMASLMREVNESK